MERLLTLSPTSKILLAVPVVVTGLLATRLAYLTAKYKLHNNRKPNLPGATKSLKDIYRVPSTFTIAYWGDENGGMETLLNECKDKEGRPIPVSHHVKKQFVSPSYYLGT